ncbi:hypothetical protein [Xylophilus sp. GOD-11R]|uniref:hypothetical protein n=1 Tax=Xylophilus sp. GOD-11R TaxID=3089814 RepID=UPI00298CC886|nr:hypothetical protein [Xylophilus sp. GOD-11R]WPB56943.1 hypothetical protein R9X41_22875 [Xylophilus sp. GOD-11R]
MSTYLKILNHRDFSAITSGFLTFDMFQLITYPHLLRINHYNPEQYSGIMLLLNREGPAGVEADTDPKLTKKGLLLIDKNDVDEIVFTGNVKIGPAYSSAYSCEPYESLTDDYPKREVRLTLNQSSIQTFEPFPYSHPGKTFSMILMQL